MPERVSTLVVLRGEHEIDDVNDKDEISISELFITSGGCIVSFKL